MSQVNHCYDYIFVVDGHTVWERLRNIRNFLTDRRKALAIANLSTQKIERKRKKLQSQIDQALGEIERTKNEIGDKETHLLYLQDQLAELQHELDTMEVEVSDHPNLTQDCADEVKFLEAFEARLMVEAEKERVPGKTDREMYEINFPNEARVRLFKKATAELASMKTLTVDTIHYLRKDPIVLQQICGMGFKFETQNGLGETVVEKQMLLDDMTRQLLLAHNDSALELTLVDMSPEYGIEALSHVTE